MDPRPSLLLGCLVFLLGSLAAGQAAPRGQVDPADGREDVPAGRCEIRIRFDQDMDGGMSVTRTDLPFPKLVEKPRWIDARSLLLVAELEPDTRYGFGINGQGLKGFKSRSGRVAESRRVSLRTLGGLPLDEKAKLEIIARLRKALGRDYSHRELHGIDADFELDLKTLLAAGSLGAFAEALVQDLGRIRDPHMSLRAGKRVWPCYRRSYVANASAPVLARRIGNWRKITNNCASAEIEGGVHYVLLATLADEASVAGAIASIQAAAEARAFIIDLRLNGGGDEKRARRLAGLFTAERRLYAKHRSVEVEAKDGFGPVQDRWLLPARPSSSIEAPVAVLMGPACLSSAEALILMFRAIPGATLIGATSGGSSGNPRPIELGSGLTIHLPGWIAMDSEGRPFEGRGLEPDIPVETEPADLAAGRDPVLDRALVELRRILADRAEAAPR